MLIIGAKGFAKELLETIIQNNPDAEIVFYDDISQDLPDLLFEKYPIVRTAKEAEVYFKEKNKNFVLGIGSPALRHKFYEKFKKLGGSAATVISPFAKIGKIQNVIQEGVNILTDAIIESNNIIGRGSLIHVKSLVSHDVKVGDFCEISPNANLLGNVKIGDFCRLGTGCVILPKIKLGNNVIVGAGAVVTKDVPNDSMVVGIPAQIVKRLEPIQL